MAEYKTSVQTNYGFPLSFDATNKAPIIAKRIWNTYADALEWVNDDKQFAIVGLQLSVINDPDPKKNGVYFVSKIGEGAVDENGNKTGGEIIKVGSGEGSMAIPNFTIKEGTEDKVEEAASDNIGQIIYITTGTDSFPAGPYIVTGSGTVAKLGTTTASGDLAGDVTALKGRMGEAESAIETLENKVGDSTNGLIKEVNALKTKTANLVVNDVKDNGVSLANADGIVDLSNYTLNSELQTEFNKLNTAISEIKVPEYTIEEASAGAGVAKAYQLKKDGNAIGATINIPVDMVVTGAEMVDVDGEGKEGKFIKLTIANAEKSELYIDVTELLNNYSAGDYITVSGTGTISVNIDTLEAYLNTKYDATGAAAAVQSDLDAHKTANEEAFKAYTKTTDLDNYIGTTLGYAKTTEVDTKISTALNDYTSTANLDNYIGTTLGYAKTTEVASSISTTLESYTKTADLNTYIGTTLGYATKTEVASSISTTLTDYIKTNDVEAKVATFGYAKAADVESTYVKQADLNALTTDDIDDIINSDKVTE